MKKKFSKRIVMTSIGLVLAYTITAIVYQFLFHDQMDNTLTTCVYSFFGVELLSVAGIKISEKRKGEEQC